MRLVRPLGAKLELGAPLEKNATSLQAVTAGPRYSFEARAVLVLDSDYIIRVITKLPHQ